MVPNEMELSRAVNTAKSNYIAVINSFLHMLKLFVKHANLISGNPLYNKVPEMLEFFMISFSSLLEASPYYNLPVRSGLLECMDSVFTFFIFCLRMNDFYRIFNEKKTDLIHKVILPCLALTPR